MSFLENMVEAKYTHRFSIELDGVEISRAFAQEITLDNQRYHYLEDVWTHPEHRGQWLASKVLWTLLSYVAHDPFSHGVLLATRHGRDIDGTTHSLVKYYESLWWKTCWSEYRMDCKDGVWQDHPSNLDPEGYGVMMYRSSGEEDSIWADPEVIQRVIPTCPDQQRNGWMIYEIIQSGKNLDDYQSYPLFITTKQESIHPIERRELTKDCSGAKKMVIAIMNPQGLRH